MRDFLLTYYPISVGIWILIFPALYAFLFSRPFGIRKMLDRWILFLLHIVTSIAIFIPTYLFYFAYTGVIGICCKVVLEGLVWQFYLKDRKINGFLCSLIINVIFVLPTAILEI